MVDKSLELYELEKELKCIFQERPYLTEMIMGKVVVDTNHLAEHLYEAGYRKAQP